MSFADIAGSILPDPVKGFLRSGFRHIKPFINAGRDLRKISFDRADRLFHRSIMPENNGEIFVNLGCGTTNHPRFINVDGYPYRHVHYVHRIDRLPMFADETVDLLYASHCLEHFKYREVEQVLCEWARLLKVGGVIRLSVPDFDNLLEIYRDTGSPDDIVEQLMGGQDNRFNYHYVLFNKKYLSELLARVGFTDICEWVPGSSDLTTFEDFSVYKKDVSGRSYEISLNLEARKK